jgi:hypothetical protein
MRSDSELLDRPRPQSVVQRTGFPPVEQSDLEKDGQMKRARVHGRADYRCVRKKRPGRRRLTWLAGTAICAMNYSTKPCSSISTTPGQRLRRGLPTTTANRPHSSLKYLTPAAYAATFTATGDRLRNHDQLRRSPVASTCATRRKTPLRL